MTTTIADHLIISSPTDITEAKVWAKLDNEYMSAAPPFRFRRSREIDAQANDLLAQELTQSVADDWLSRDSVQSIREMLEQFWAPGLDATPAVIATKGANHIVEYPAADTPPETNSLPNLFKPTIDGTQGGEVTEGSVIAWAQTDGDRENVYFLLTSDIADSLNAGQFKGSTKKYLNTWNSDVSKAQRVFPKDAAQYGSSHEFIDLSVGAIVQRYPFLSEQQDLYETMRENVSKKIPEEKNYALAQAFFGEVQNLNQEIARLKRSTSSLVGYAASKGYLLMEDSKDLDTTNRGVAQGKFSAQKGDLIATTRFVTRWVDEHVTHHRRKRLFRRSKRWTTIKRINRSAVDVKYRRINGTDSMVADFIRENLSDKDVVILQNTGVGFEADDGRSLIGIMERCELDPQFQASCVLLMPVYKQNLFGDDIIAGYHVIRRPTRGRRIVGLPDFFFEEQIAYKLRWQGMELGELMTSINLLPGEVRDISIKTKRTSLHEDELKSSQNFEAESNTSFDTVSSVENEFQRENTSEKTKSWSVKASGSYGAFSAGGSASGSSKKTARQFAKSLNKLTTQAISKMRKSTRSEVVARELHREELEFVTSSSGQISNPNVGRTLNVNYFAVNNVFASATYLDDVGFTYISPFELIDGTDIREVRTYSKEQLQEFLERVEDDVARMFGAGLYFKMTAEAGGESLKMSREDRAEAANKFAAKFVQALTADFLAAFQDYSADVDDAKKAADKQAVCAFLIRPEANKARVMDPASDNNLQQVINRLVATGEPIEPGIVISPSAAVYADATIGASEGLESYAVDMRKLEVERKMADVIATMTTSKSKSKASLRTHYNVSHKLVSKDKLSIQIGGDIAPGKWNYRIGATEVGTLSIIKGTDSYDLKLDQDAPDIAKLGDLAGSLVRHD